MRYTGIIFFFLVCAHLIYAQGAKFTVNSEIACHPFTVVVTDLSGVPDTVAVNYDYGDGSALDTARTHTYANPGTYRIIQTVANANPRQDTAFVEVIDQYPPEFFLFNCKGNNGSVFIRDTLYEAYHILWGDGTSQTGNAFSLITHNYGVVGSFNVTVQGLINGTQAPSDNSNTNCSMTTKTLNMINSMQPAVFNNISVTSVDGVNGDLQIGYTLFPDNNYLIEIQQEGQPGFLVVDTIVNILNPASYTLSNLNTRDYYYNVSITAFDPCDGTRIQSNIGSSIRLAGIAENRQNRISWQTQSVDFRQYNLIKDGSNLTTIFAQNQNQYMDNQVVCGGQYSYQVELTENNGFTSTSGVVSVIAISTDVPDAITDITASVDGKNIELTWEEPTTYLATSYILRRSTNGIDFEILDTLTSNNFTDENLYTQSKSYYYNVRYLDACGNLSAMSLMAQPVLLRVSPDQQISWTNYQGWQAGVNEYILEKYDENGQLLQRISMGLTTSYTEDQTNNPYQIITYKIIAIPQSNLLREAFSNTLELIYRSKVAFPNAFSPNGDGDNDVFNFKSRFITSVIMKIFNRWGELVYQTTDPDRGWDGNIGSRPAPLGTYIHHTQLTDDMGVTFIKSGEIILIR